MKDSDIKKLSRSDLIEIIYQLQLNERKLREELRETQQKLEDKQMHISDKLATAGSIAEAVVGLSGIFETAQAAADQYLSEIHRLPGGHQPSAPTNVDADKYAASIIRDAELKSKQIMEEADREVQAKWTALQKRADELIRARAELSVFIKD